MSGYPVEVEAFQQTIGKLKGMASVESGVENLEGVESEALGDIDCSHLPHAALLRTRGGLAGEILCQVEFVIDRTSDGLDALAFLAWFIRDQARGGTKVQLRPFALPPESPQGRQLGTSLKFHIDLFQDGITETLDPLFATLKEMTKVLELAIALYHIPVKSETE